MIRNTPAPTDPATAVPAPLALGQLADLASLLEVIEDWLHDLDAQHALADFAFHGRWDPDARVTQVIDDLGRFSVSTLRHVRQEPTR